MYDVNKSRNYSEVLREFRLKTGLTQERAAKQLGVRQKTISDWETGKSSARDFMAGVKFAILAIREGVSVEDLILNYPDPLSVGESGADYSPK